MKRNRNIQQAGLLAYVLSMACVLYWSTGFVYLDGQPSVIRLILIVIGLVLLSGVIYCWHRKLFLEHQQIRRHFETLCWLDPCDLSSDTTLVHVPSLPAKSHWHRVSESLRRTLQAHCRQYQEVQHSRTAMEIRCRRTNTQYENIKTILTGLNDPILVVDAFDELVLANRAAEDLFDFNVESASIRALHQVVSCEKLVDLLQGTSRCKTLGSRTDEVEIQNRDGQMKWFRAFTSKLATNDQGPGQANALAVLRNIDSEKNLQQHNSEFVSAVSHEMKTPLAGIMAYVELLLDGDAEDEETLEEFLNVINGQANRLRRLVDNLLNLARIEAGVARVEKSNCSLNELLEEAADVVQPSADSKQIRLDAELSTMFLGVFVDRDMLLQSAINLLSNAVKYTPNEGRVTLRSRLDGDQGVSFEIEDSGVGLCDEDQRRVFEKFYRVKNSQKMATGTGLGLPLAKHIVEDVHGGQLRVESQVGKGSKFTVQIPFTDQNACNDRRKSSDTRASNGSPAHVG